MLEIPEVRALLSVSVLRHRATVMLAKGVGKVLEVDEVATCGDVLDASVGGFQQRGDASQSRGVDGLQDRGAGQLAETQVGKTP